MESQETMYLKLDQDFDKLLAEMKPHVLKLPHKTDRQKCAVWIKKLCEPTSGLTGRKNRNTYGQLMLHMLKRGVLEGPFTSKPKEGALPTLPTYMTNKVPDWVAGELTTSTAGSSLFRSEIGNPTAHSTWRSGASPHLSPRRRPHTSLGFDLDREPAPRKDYLQKPPDPTLYSYDDLSVLGNKKRQREGYNYHSDDEDSFIGGATTARNGAKAKKTTFGEVNILSEVTDWSRGTAPLAASLTNPYLKSSTYSEESSLGKGGQGRETQMRTKVLEAKFHEEKLKLQQKHDAAVQKILDRKNAEIEDVKGQYRAKAKEMEDTIGKMEKKIQTIMKESQHVHDTKDKQISELRKMLDQVSDSKKNEFEKKINDIVSEFEQEKFEMQKQHTKSIQEILDDTNARLQKMEKENSQQTLSTANVIKELETRVQELMKEADGMKKSRNRLEKEKADLETQVERLQACIRQEQEKALLMEQDHQRALEAHDQDLRALQRKTESNIEFMKQEHNLASAKAAETISELEQHIDQLKRTLKDAEEQRQRQIREMEQHHQQNKFHLETMHEKQVNSVKKELDQLEQDSQKKVKGLEHTIREREDEIKRLGEKNKHQAEQAEKALEEFKVQVEKNQTRMFDDMKQQMSRVETDLNRSKQAREKQAKEFNKQIDEEKQKHEREVVELKMSFEHEKAQLLKDFHVQKEYIHSEHEKETESLKESHRLDVADLEKRSQSRQDKDSKKVSSLEHQCQDLREEVVQANQLRKQQLVELGLLREEEKQKMQRDHEAEISKLRSEMEQQRLELQKTHSTEMEQMLEKTNGRLKSIENEYSERGQKATETITELNSTVYQLREEMKNIRETCDKKVSDIMNKNDEDRKAMRKQYSSNLGTVQKELDSQYTKVRTLERQTDKQEADYEEKITHLKLSYEERLRGMMPVAVRQELEGTIESLKSQVNSLQQKALILQEELDMNNKFSLQTFATTSSPIKSSV